MVRHQVSENTITIEFDTPAPDHWRLICHAAAIWGNKAAGVTFHETGVSGGKTLGKVTARDSKIVEWSTIKDSASK